MAKKKIQGARQKRKAEATANKPNLEAVDSPAELLIKASNAFNAGDVQTTLAICQNLLDADQNNEGALNLVGCAYAAHNRPDKAVEYFNKVIELNPTADGYYLNAGRAYLLMDKYAEAEQYLKKAVEINPHPESYFWLSRTYATQMKLSQAEECFRETLKLQPNHLPSLENLSAILEQLNKLDDAEEIINHITSNNLQSYGYLLTQAKIQRRRKNFEDAKQSIEKFLLFARTDKEKGHGLNEKAKILDQEGSYNDAFDVYTKAQNKAYEVYKTKNQEPYFNKMLESSLEWFTKDNIEDWPTEPVETLTRIPVFLLGFSRSGTTLAEQVISAHPEIISAQETNIIDDILVNMGSVLGYAPHYPHVLNDFTDDNIKDLRAQYWAEMGQVFAGEDVSNKLIVDKMPFNIAVLGFIYRLFPEAKVICMIRDPRDVCLSNFMQQFVPNSTMSNFYNLDSTTNLYKDVMKLYGQYKSLFPYNLMELRYEDLVDDLETNARKLIEFTGLNWNEDCLSYYDANKDRDIKTPSYEGVSQPIYKSSVSRWKNYEKHIAPFADKLDPFIKEYNY